jgi:hypothetical protein
MALSEILFLFHHLALSFHTDKKENTIFLIFKEIQMGAVAESCMTLQPLPSGFPYI